MITRRLLIGGAGAALVSPALVAPQVSAADRAGRPESVTSPPPNEPVRLRFPRPTGPFPVGTTELHLVDHHRDDPYVPGRPRELMISVWYPSRGGAPRAPYLPPLTAESYGKDAAGALRQPVDAVDWAGARSHAGLLAPVSRSWGRRPVVLFSPGFGVPRGLASIMVAELASRGYVVVTVDHTYEVAAVQFPGERLEVQTLPTGPYARMARAARLADVRFVLTALGVLASGRNPDAGRRRLPAGLGSILDLRRIGAYGHSAGGITAADLMDVDRRVGAGIDFDGTLGYGYSVEDPAPVVRRGLDRPFLLMGAGAMGPGHPPQTHRTEPSWGMFWENSTGWKRDLNVPEGMHYTFIDYQALIPWFDRFFDVPADLKATMIGTVDPVRILRSLRTYVPAFFDQHLRDRPRPDLWAHSSPRHPDVEFVV